MDPLNHYDEQELLREQDLFGDGDAPPPEEDAPAPLPDDDGDAPPNEQRPHSSGAMELVGGQRKGRHTGARAAAGAT